MPKKIINDRPLIPVKRQFTDRDNYKNAFRDALENLKPDEVKVLTYYGIGGIGKTALRKELQKVLKEEYDETVTTVLDFSVKTHQVMENALIYMCSDLKQKHKVKFPMFELAFLIYMKKVNTKMALNQQSLPFLDEGDFLSQALLELKDIPVVGLLPKIYSMAGKGAKGIKGLMDKNKLDKIAKIPEMEPKDILELLPAIFAMDLKEHFEADLSPIHAVIFIDTYEALWEGDRNVGSFCERDDWLHKDGMLIGSLPGVLWVICGREKLRWHEKDPDWEGSLLQYPVGKLADDDAKYFLSTCGIGEEDIQAAIVKSSEGVPYYLDLSVDTYDKIKEKREPGLGDFAGAKTPVEVFERFIKYLDRQEKDTLYMLSAPRFWEYELFAALVGEFKTGFPLTSFQELCRFSFIDKRSVDGAWEMHSLMRKSLQEHQDSDLRKRVHGFMRGYYAGLLEDIDIKNITSSQTVALAEAFYHGLAYDGNVDEFEPFFNWFMTAANKFTGAARWGEVLPLYMEFLAYLEQKEGFGEEHPYVATTLNNLAGLYQAQGKYEEAEPLYKRALQISEKVLGEEHPSVASMLNNLAALYQAQGKYEEAEPLYKRALQIREKVLGEEHPYVATTLNNLAGLYQAQGKYEEAEPLYKRALQIREKVLGEEHPSVATTLNNLAGLYQAQGKYEEAEPLYKRALQIREKVLGEEHPDVATTLNNLAGLYQAQGKYEEAKPLYKRALQRSEKVLGEEHPYVASMLNNLAALYQAQGKYEEAEPLYKRALQIREKVLGEEHPDVATTLNNLALLYQAQGKYEEAEPLYKRALQIREKVLGEEHPDVASMLNNLAALYQAQGKYEEAEPLYKRALQISEKVLGEEHPDVAGTLNNLALLYHAQGKYEEAEPLYKKALRIVIKALGLKHPYIGMTVNNLAKLYKAMGKFNQDEFKEELRRLLANGSAK